LSQESQTKQFCRVLRGAGGGLALLSVLSVSLRSILVFCSSCVSQLLNKRIYDDDDDGWLQISLRDGYQSTKKASEVSKTPKRANILAKQVKRPPPTQPTVEPATQSQPVGVVNSQQYGHVVEPPTNQQLAGVSPQHAPATQLPPVDGVFSPLFC